MLVTQILVTYRATVLVRAGLLAETITNRNQKYRSPYDTVVNGMKITLSYLPMLRENTHTHTHTPTHTHTHKHTHTPL